MSDRIEFFEKMIAGNPENVEVLFGLANEYLKSGNTTKAIEHFEAYILKSDDEGAAYGMLSTAYEEQGLVDKARKALEDGISAALAHGHPTMAGEFRERLAAFG